MPKCRILRGDKGDDSWKNRFSPFLCRECNERMFGRLQDFRPLGHSVRSIRDELSCRRLPRSYHQLLAVSASLPIIHNAFLIRNSGTLAPPLLSTTCSTASKPQAR